MKQETDECARAVHNILRSHMAIQDDLFRPTWRKIIRIPGVYRPVPYGEKRDELRALAEQLHEIRTRIKGMKPEGDDEDGRFLISLRAYCTSLSESILALSDICGRLGGDEFAVLLPNATPEAAHAVAEKIRTLALQTTVPLDGLEVSVCLSIGIACGSGDDFDALLARADHAMYEAKRVGPNRIVAAPAT